MMAVPQSTSKKYTIAAGIGVIILVAVVAGVYLSSRPSSSVASNTVASNTTSALGSGSGTVVNIVAAENFWGSLVSQLAGSHGNVTSIVSDPNTDPHQYQSDPANAKAIANAKLVIINGMDYDTWASLLINASNTPGQVVLDAQTIVGLSNAEIDTVNPHLWYSPWYVNDTDHAMYKALVKIDPTDTAYFTANYASLNSSLYHSYMQLEDQMRAHYGGSHPVVTQNVLRNYSGGVDIAATESIVQFMANATGLNIITPVPFMFAVAEGNDPAPADIATFAQQLTAGNASVSCIVYNIQTVMPVTQQMKTIAAQYEVPITDVSETVQPPSLPFQAWQQGEVAGLQNCLNSIALGN
jgi:zinc/manganese transport system substrate-binding protein